MNNSSQTTIFTEKKTINFITLSLTSVNQMAKQYIEIKYSSHEQNVPEFLMAVSMFLVAWGKADESMINRLGSFLEIEASSFRG